MSYKGIDVSSARGVIDWDKVSDDGVQFVILHAGYGDDISQVDSQFVNNIKGAISHNIKIGIYWFSYAVDEADAMIEADICRQVIQPYHDNITLPVFYDYEYDSVNYYRRVKGIAPTDELINKMTISFCNRIQSYGFKAGVYFNKQYQTNIYTPDTLNRYVKWFAYYSGIQSGYDFQQTTSSGSVNGVSGNVDMDICFDDSYFVKESFCRSDTNGEMKMKLNSTYQFKITSDKLPTFQVGNKLILSSEFVKQDGNDYFFKIHSNNNIGSVGIYVNGERVCIVNVVSPVFQSDTTGVVKIKQGQCYQAKITSDTIPYVVSANQNVIKAVFVKQDGNNYFWKFYAVGVVGISVGIYINKQPRATFVCEII